MNYSDYRKVAKTGDIFLFSGKGNISDIIKYLTKGRWSHIGMVLAPTPDIVLLWESTTLSNLVDIDTQRQSRGVQVVELSRRLRTYEGEVALRQIEPALTPAQESILFLLRHEFKSRKYEQSLIELFRSAWDWIGGQNKADLSSLFCSEMVAEAFMAMGLIERTGSMPANEFTPTDFAQGNKIDEMMQDGVSRLGLEIQYD